MDNVPGTPPEGKVAYNDWLRDEMMDLDFKKLFFKYFLRFWYLYLIFPAIALAGAWTYLRYKVPTYQVSATLLIRDQNENIYSNISEKTIFSDFAVTGSDRNLQDEMLILRSGDLMEEVINELGLAKSFFYEGRIMKREVYKTNMVRIDTMVLSPSAYNKLFEIEVLDDQLFRIRNSNFEQVYRFGELFVNTYGAFKFSLNNNEFLPANTKILLQFFNPTTLAKSLAASIQIKTISGSRGLELSMNTPVPEKGVDILNTLITKYNRKIIANKNEVEQNTLNFVEERLADISQELAAVELDVEEFKSNNRILNNETFGGESSLSKLEEIQKELYLLESEQQLLVSLQNYLTEQDSLLRPVPLNLTSQSAVNEAITSFNELLFQRDELLKSAKPGNKAVKDLNDRILFLRSRLLSSLDITIADLNRSIQVQKTKYDQVLQGIEGIPSKERQLTEILRQQSIKETLFLYLLQKREEAKLSIAIATTNSVTIYDASQHGGPISPNRSRVQLIALLIGLAIPVAIAVLVDVFDDKIKTFDDIKAGSGIPILGAISISKSSQPLVIGSESRTAIAEYFRLVRTNLQFLVPDQKQLTIMVTSNASGEGKSFISLNLAASLALSKKKVLLISLDLRKPKLRKYLDLDPDRKGITNWLIEDSALEEILYKVNDYDNFYLIPSGPIPPNPAELIMSDRMQQLLDRMKKDFDYIVIDTPPIGLVADAFLLSQAVDIAIFTLRYNLTPKFVLKQVEELRRSKKFKRLGFILNGTKKAGRYGYKGYGYGYGYGYDHGYFTPEN